MELICHRTGLTQAEIILICRCFNGAPPLQPDAPEIKRGGVFYGREVLQSQVSGEAANAHSEMLERGVWLETFDSNPEQPYELSDLFDAAFSG